MCVEELRGQIATKIFDYLVLFVLVIIPWLGFLFVRPGHVRTASCQTQSVKSHPSSSQSDAEVKWNQLKRSALLLCLVNYVTNLLNTHSWMLFYTTNLESLHGFSGLDLPRALFYVILSTLMSQIKRYTNYLITQVHAHGKHIQLLSVLSDYCFRLDDTFRTSNRFKN